MRTALPALFGCLLLAACATDPAARDANRAALYRAHAGAPVDSFPYLRVMTQWTPLGPDAVAIWTSPSRAWLLDVPGCTDLEWARAISISESAGRVSARFDRVTPIGASAGRMPCRIEQIRPLDVKAIREAERALRAQR